MSLLKAEIQYGYRWSDLKGIFFEPAVSLRGFGNSIALPVVMDNTCPKAISVKPKTYRDKHFYSPSVDKMSEQELSFVRTVLA